MSDARLDPEIVLSVRQRLWDAGFRPLAIYNIDEPVNSPGKHPVGGNWTDRARLDPPEAVSGPVWPKALNTGILCDGLRAMDVDVDDSALAYRICALATERFGDTIKRWRSNSGRSLLVYRAKQGEPEKRSLAGKLGKIEFLGRGQQFVSHGLHPTGAMLQWAPDALEEFPLHTLPSITEDQITAFFTEVAPLIEAEAAKPNGAGNGHASDHGLESNLLDVATALRDIPNTGPADWEFWNKIGMATYAATAGSSGGFDAWVAWSKRHSSFDPSHAAERWDNYGRSPPTQIGAGSLYHLAKEARSRKSEQNERRPEYENGDPGPVDPDGWFFDENKSDETEQNPEGNLHGDRINAADLDRKEFTPVEWLIEGFMPQGLTLLAGKSKIGKSWLVLDLALAVASGASAFDKINTVQCDVLYLCLEDNQRRLQKRMRSLLGQSQAPDRLTFALTWQRMDDGGLDRLNEYLDHHPACRLVIIDTLAMVRGRPDRNEQPYERDYKDMGMFRNLAHRRNISVMIVHHTKKQEQSDIFDMISGTTGLQGAVDTMIVLARSRGAPAGTLNITGRDIVDDGEFAVTFHKTTGKWEILGEASAINRDTKQAAVLNFLIAQGEPVGPGEIAAELHVSSGYVKVCLRRLRKDGFVESPTAGLWQATRQDDRSEQLP